MALAWPAGIPTLEHLLVPTPRRSQSSAECTPDDSSVALPTSHRRTHSPHVHTPECATPCPHSNPVTPPRPKHLPTLRYSLSTASTRLGSAFGLSAQQIGFMDRWFVLLPSRIGHNATPTDLSARVFLAGANYFLHRTPAVQREYQESYVLALKGLRKTLGSDDDARAPTDKALLAGTMLACAEFAAEGPSLMQQHLKGVSAIMITQKKVPGQPASELTRAAVYCNWVGTFARPVALGIASPFEPPYWHKLTPADCVSRFRTSPQILDWQN